MIEALAVKDTRAQHADSFYEKLHQLQVPGARSQASQPTAVYLT